MSTLQPILLAVAIVVFGTFAYGGISAAPWVPTLRRVRERMAELVDPKPGAVVYDLGSGDGGILFAIADRQPEARCVGIEVAVLPYLVAQVRRLLGGSRYRHVSFRYGDMFRARLDDADAVTVFLLGKAYPRLLPKLRDELRDDAVVLLEAWPFDPAIPPLHVVRDEGSLPIYVYDGASLRRANGGGSRG